MLFLFEAKHLFEYGTAMLFFLYDKGVLLELEVRLHVANVLVERADNTLQRRGRTIHRSYGENRRSRISSFRPVGRRRPITYDRKICRIGLSFLASFRSPCKRDVGNIGAELASDGAWG